MNRQSTSRVRRRQDPVSCQLCRAKKLKCDRQNPCSNCSARGVVCQFEHGEHRGDHTFPRSDNDGVLSRLARLEERVFGKRDEPPAMSSQQSSPAASATNEVNEEHRTTSQWLEGIGARGGPIFPGPLDSMPLRIQPIRQFLAEPRLDVQDVPVPSKDEAIILFEHYLENAHPLHPVIDPQSMNRIMDGVYAQPYGYNRRPCIALLLSIFASASHFWAPNQLSIFESTENATFMSSVWSKAALDILQHSRQTTSSSIEDIQATIVVCSLIFNAHGFSAMMRSLHSIVIMMARDLCLHKTDAQRGKRKDVSEEATVEDEIKRRIWWHITSTDWLLAFSPGPQQGTYSIHPAHMRVNKPQTTGNTESIHSSLSYLLQRIRLAEICRDTVDTLPRFLDDTEGVKYSHIIALDTQFENLVNNLPIFFRLGHESDNSYSRHATTECYLIHLGIYTRRIKLHQPFLMRGFTEPKYAYSRDACLRSARTVLEVYRMLEEKKGSLACIPARLGTVVHHVFMGAVVLVMDLCFNKDKDREEQRQAEVMQACRMLDELRLDNAMAAKFLNPLMEILQKHNPSVISPTSPTGAQQTSMAAEANPNEHVIVDDPETAGPQTQAHDMDFDTMMRNYVDLGQDVGIPVWEDLFADFDSYHALDAEINDLFG